MLHVQIRLIGQSREEAAEGRWRSVNVPHLVALVRAGVTFVDGITIEREDQGNAA